MVTVFTVIGGWLTLAAFDFPQGIQPFSYFEA